MTEQVAPWIEVEVTIETTIESKATHQIDRLDFAEWSGGRAPEPSLLREYLRAGEEWEVCSEIYEAGKPGDVIDCEITGARPAPSDEERGNG